MAATLKTAALSPRGDRTHFNSALFDDEIAAHGARALWRRASVCPCLDPVRGVWRADCPYCRDGTLYDLGSEIRVIAASRSRRDEVDVIGRRMEGRLTLTFPSTVLPGHFDLVTLLDAEMVVDNEFLTRGEVDRLGRSRERTRMPVVRVERCAVIQPDDSLLFFEEGADFTIANGSEVAWVVGRGPAADSRYALRYVARPTFIVWSPMSRDEGGNRQPYRVEAQRFDFWRRDSVGDPGA